MRIQSPPLDVGLQFALGPLLLAQGLYVRKTIPKLPEPQGDRAGICGSGRELRLLILGDSAAAGVGAASQSEALSGQVVSRLSGAFRVSWRLLAHTGYTTRATLRRLEQEPPAPFDVALTSLGVNDVTSGRTLNVWLREQSRLAGILRQKFSVRHFLLSGLPPVGHFPSLPHPLRFWLGRRAERFDGALERWAASQPDCDYMGVRSGGEVEVTGVHQMATDGFHPGPEIYAMWGEAASKRIRARWDSAASH